MILEGVMTRRKAQDEEQWTSQESVSDAGAAGRGPAVPPPVPDAPVAPAPSPGRRGKQRSTWLGPPRAPAGAPTTSSPRAVSPRAPTQSPGARSRARALVKNLGPVWDDEWADTYPEYAEHRFTGGKSGAICPPCGFTTDLDRRKMNRHLLSSDHLDAVDGQPSQRLVSARAKLRRLGGVAAAGPAGQHSTSRKVKRGDRVPPVASGSQTGRTRAPKRSAPTTPDTPITLGDSDG